MENRIKIAKWALSIGVASIALLPQALLAQQTPPAAAPAANAADQTADSQADNGQGEDIVVTGTLLRGVAPGGSQTIAIDSQRLKAIGAAETSAMLTQIPQAGNFLQIVTSNPRVAVNRPTLRNLGNTSAGSASTLVLLDGHRMVGMGVRQTSPDIDAIPAGAIERIEIVTDGGSSTYGSDAVGGVLNFITRKRFDGLQVNGRYGVGPISDTFDTGLTVGNDWGWGSAYLSYSYSWSKTSGVMPFSVNRDWINNVPFTTNCSPANVTATGQTGFFFPLPSLVKSAIGNRCDYADRGEALQNRHSAFGSLSIDRGGPVTFDVKGFFFSRKNRGIAGPYTGSATLAPSNVNYLTIPGVSGPGINETFLYSLEAATGPTTRTDLHTQAWGITPQVHVNLGSDWRLNALFNMGSGRADYNNKILNGPSLSAAATAGTFNPGNIAAPGNTAAIATALDWFDFGRARDRIVNARAVFDGPLIALPAGDVKVAVGGEIMRENYKAAILQGGTAATIGALLPKTVSRTIKSAFGEISIPILGPNSGIFHSLKLTGSGRWDDYSDVGDTFNPKVGVDFEPVEWLKLRGNWGKSFQAPSLSDSSVLTPGQFINLGSVRFVYTTPTGAVPAQPGQTEVFLQGVVDPLKPQKARTISAGFDFKVPFVEGLTFGGTYYQVKFKDQIAITPVFLGNAPILFPDLIFVTPTQAQVNALLPLANNPTVLTSIPLANLYAIADGRTRNLSAIAVQGLDFYLNYKMKTGFGDIYANVGGNYILKFTQQAFAGAASIDITHNDSRFRVGSTLGAHIGNLTAQMTWNRQGPFRVTPSAANLQQSRIGTFNVFNAFLQYNIGGEDLLQDLSLTLNVDNVFNNRPPLYHGNLGLQGSGPGYANGSTLGRVFKFGIEKKF